MRAALSISAVVLICCCLVLGNGQIAAQQGAVQPAGTGPLPEQLSASGHLMVAGKLTKYLIRHLPVSSFPELPVKVVELLGGRGCTIPQTYEAHGPENVVHASLARTGSSDWAVLCSTGGMVSLLVFLEGTAGPGGGGGTEGPGAQPVVLASAPETGRLQVHDASGVLGFNWGIDPASPEQVHEAQNGMERRPAVLDHDALADSIVEHRTVYRFFSKGAWTVLAMPQ